MTSEDTRALHLLLAEDDPYIAEMLAFLFELQGHRMDIAVDFSDALKRIGHDNYDVFILDAKFAAKNGFTNAEAVQQAGIDVPVVILKGKEQVNDQLRAINQDVADYLARYLTIEPLLHGIDSTLSKEQSPAKPRYIELKSLLPPMSKESSKPSQKPPPKPAQAPQADITAKEEELESSHIFKTAVQTGIRRLNRGWLEIGISGVIAGLNVTFGALAAAAVAGAALTLYGNDGELFAKFLGAVVFPIGFIFVVMGRSELFTENFLIPTTSVIAKHARFYQLLRLWLITLVGNIIGAFIAAWMMSIEYYHGVPGIHVVEYIKELAEFKVFVRDWDASLVSGIFAGWLITLMTWLILACQTNVARIIVIWCVGFLIMVNEFNHVVVNAAEILMAKYFGSENITYMVWLERNFVPTILGNMIGGLVFVTLLEYLKVMHIFERDRM